MNGSRKPQPTPYAYPSPPPSYPTSQPPPGYPAPPPTPQPPEWRPSQPGVVVAVDRVFGIFSSTGTKSATNAHVSETTVNTYSSQKYAYDFDCTTPTTSTTCSQTQTISALDLSLDPVLVIAPIPHVGFLVGPTVDIALSGKETFDLPPSTFTDPNAPAMGDQDFRQSSFGVAAGVALFL